MAVQGPLHDGYKRLFFPLSFSTESATEAPNRTPDADVNVALPLRLSPHYEGEFRSSVPLSDKEKSSIHLQDQSKTFKNMYGI